MEFIPHNYQGVTIAHMRENDFCGAFTEMGTGKTVSTLTVLNELVYGLRCSRVLIIAPLMVAKITWSDECEKWDHLRHFKIAKVLGTAKQRITALERTDADAWIINRENVVWLVNHFKSKPWPFDRIVIDELSSFKNPESARFKALKKIRPYVDGVIGLTGTPAPNGLLDLWAQLYLIDLGKRLEQTLTNYRALYFTPAVTNGHQVYTWALRKGAGPLIHKKISDICFSLRARDHLKLPKRTDVVRKVYLENYMRYLDFKQEQVLTLDDGEEITPANAGVMYLKLLQFANGAVYKDQYEREYSIVDQAKLDTLCEAVEELQGDPVIIFYQFQSDLARLRARIPHGLKISADHIPAWNAGKIPVLFAHAASAGHGLNLQHGGRYIFWYGAPLSLELYQQAVARLDRQGQKRPVFNVHFVAAGTVDELVLSRLNNKAETQNNLMVALKKHLLA